MIDTQKHSSKYLFLISALAIALVLALELAFKVYFQEPFKRPLCIDSRIVYKIDSLGEETKESVYSCNQDKAVDFSEYFYENLKALEARLFKLEIIFNQLGISNRFVIMIDHVNKNQILLLPNGIQIGVDKLATQFFEKKLLELGIKNKFNIQNQIYLEALADYFLGSQDYQNLVSEAWNISLKEFNYFEKNKLLNAVVLSLKTSVSRLNNTTVVASLPNEGEFEVESIQEFKSVLGNLQTLSYKENRISEVRDRFSEIESNFNKSLNNFGFYNTKELQSTQFDLIIETKFLKNDISEFVDWSKKNLELKAAIQTDQGLFLLPSLVQVSEGKEQTIYSKFRIIFNSSIKTSSILNRYINNSESLILMNLGTKVQQLKLSPLFTAKKESAVGQFLSQNKQFDFIQIHLPSYKLKYKELINILNYFDFVKDQNFTSTEYKALGWNHSEWLRDFNAFKPVAYFDVIQYYRIN